MIAVLQRVLESKVVVDGETVGECGRGLLILVGVEKGDEKLDAELLSEKILKLRIFEDENEKMNLSVTDVGGSALVISNFTLLAAYRKGNRPDYMNSASPADANALYEYFRDLIAEKIPTGSGIFGADMKVHMIGDGPVTIRMDSRVLKRERPEF